MAVVVVVVVVAAAAAVVAVVVTVVMDQYLSGADGMRLLLWQSACLTATAWSRLQVRQPGKQNLATLMLIVRRRTVTVTVTVRRTG